MNQNAHLLANHDVRKLLIKYSIPAIAGMAVNALYNFVDTLFVARGAGEIAIGGLALVFPIQMITMAFALMIGMGAASIFSRAYGEKNDSKMHQSVNTAMWLALFISFVMSILGFFFLNQLLTFFGATEANLGYAKEYMSVILIGLVPVSLTMVLNNLTRAEGRANVAMVSMMIGTGLNIILDPIFIFDWGFGLGVRGAAIATVISQVIAFIFIFIQSQSHKSILHVSFRGAPFHGDMAKEIMVIGAPTFLRNSIGAFLAILIYNVINHTVSGDPAIYISIYGVISRVLSFVFMPSFGLVQGMAPIVGFNYGAKSYQRLHDVVGYTLKLILGYFVIMFVFVQVFAEGIFLLFSSGDSPIFVSTGAEAFRVLSIGFLMVGFQIHVSSVYQSEGYPVRSMIVALSRQVLFFIPFLYLISHFYGIPGIWIAFASADILAGGLSLLLYLHENKRIHQLVLDSQPATT